MQAKGEPPDSAKKGSYVRLVYTLLKGNEKTVTRAEVLAER